MEAHILSIQIIQGLIVLAVTPVLLFYVLRMFIKVKVHREVYGTDLNRYIKDKVLEKQAKLNRNQEG